MKLHIFSIFPLLVVSFLTHGMDELKRDLSDEDGDYVIIDESSHFIRAFRNHRNPDLVVRLDLVTGIFKITERMGYPAQIPWSDDVMTYDFPVEPNPIERRLRDKIEKARLALSVDALPPLNPKLIQQRLHVKQVHDKRR